MIRCIAAAAVTLLALCSPAYPSQAALPRGQSAAHTADASRVRAHIAALALGFEPNRGQTASGVRYLAHGAGYSAFLTDRGLTLAVAPRRPGGAAAALQLSPIGATLSRPKATHPLGGTVS